MLAALARKLRFEPDDVGYILPFEEVVEALGRVAEHDLGLQTIELDSIVGTVDRTKHFDRDFPPTPHPPPAQGASPGPAPPPPAGRPPGGGGPRRRGAGARRPRRSPSTGSASCTS